MPKKDYVNTAIQYAEEVVADTERKRHGRWEIYAARRFLDDLVRCGYRADLQQEAKAHRCPFTFSSQHAELFCEFIECLPHVEGKWKTKNIELVPAQVFILVQLFGFRNLEDGRRFTTLLLAIARKNAKSTLAAAIIIACWCLEDEMEPQAISAATTGSQARIVWNIAKKMLEKTPDLCTAFKIRIRANDILGKGERGGIFKPINSRASTQDGLNPCYTVLDEVHAHETHDLLNVLQSAGGARSNPLWMFTTTEGYETPGPWPEQRNFAEQVLQGDIKADHYLAVIFCVDDEDDDFDESTWCKANPLIYTNPIIMKTNKELAIEAKAMPGKLAEFRIKRLNRRAATSNGFVNMIRWNECAGKITLDDLKGFKCYGAFDLASTTDMNAWRLLWDLDDGTYATWGRYWVPEEMVKQRTVRNTVPYAGWVAAKWLTVTPGEVTDYNIIQQAIMDDYERFNMEKIVYDPWNALQLATNLDSEGLNLEQFVQGTKSFNPAMKYFEEVYLAGNLVHDNNPILRWNMSNLITREDVNKNIAPDRKRAKEKVDGAVALIMAFGAAAADQEEFVTIHRKKAS